MSIQGFAARRIARTFTFEVAAAPGVVFPLLCPVREREWIEGWKADIVYSTSGLAEDNCLFTSENKLLGEGLYVVSRYERENGVIEFVIFYAGKAVQKLDIAIRPNAKGGTHITWRRLLTGLSPTGNALIEQLTEESFRQQMGVLSQSLDRYSAQEAAKQAAK